MHCSLCYRDGHDMPSCPDALAMLAARPSSHEPPTDADEATQHRIHLLRAALRGVVVDARRFGWVFTPETAALLQNADSFE